MPLSLYRRKDGRSPNWYVTGTVTVWRDGRPREISINDKSTRTADRRIADAVRQQIEARYAQQTVQNRAPAALISDLVESYLDAGKPDRFLKPIVAALGDYVVEDLDQTLIDTEGRKAYPGVAPATLRRQWHGPINAILNHSRAGVTFTLPAGSKSTMRFLTPEQAHCVIQECGAGRRADPWAPTLIEFLFGTGARVSEALRLTSEDVHLDYSSAILRNTKNGAERRVDLQPRTCAALARLPNLAEDGPVFRRRDGKPYAVRKNTGTELRFLESACRLLGVRMNPHMTRHSFATWFYSQTKDLLRLKLAGGWGSLEMVEVYAHLAPPHIGEDALKYGWDFKNTPARLQLECVDVPVTNRDFSSRVVTSNETRKGGAGGKS
ncbi:MAG: site-specific integrase [Pseudomonadota bacterium]